MILISFIRQPVLAIVLGIFIVILGLRAALDMPVREYPLIKNAVISVQTAYPGMDAETIAGFITMPLEAAVSQAPGIDYITSTSMESGSEISAYVLLNQDIHVVLADITAKVNAATGLLPAEAQKPVIALTAANTLASMYLGFYSHTLNSHEMTDYLKRELQPRLQSVPGVERAELFGGETFAIRIWLDPLKCQAHGIDAAGIAAILAKNNVQAAVGRFDGPASSIMVRAESGLSSVQEFKDLILMEKEGSVLRLSDVASVVLGAQNQNTVVSFDNKVAVYIGLFMTPDANELSVINNIRSLLPSLQSHFPRGLEGKVVFDATKYVQSSLDEVVASLGEALLIVAAVIFFFLGSIYTVMVPVMAIPLSLIGALFCMLIFGFSINILTLLALVLSIGLVVDDAIIVLENAYRHKVAGKTAMQAVIESMQELTGPIIAISIVLIAVYLPIGFMQGLTGALFTEFAFTVAGAVGISAVVALCITPVMSVRVLEKTTYQERSLEKLHALYARMLERGLGHAREIGVAFCLILATALYWFHAVQTELAPQEDKGYILSLLTGPANASLQKTLAYGEQIYAVFSKIPEKDHVFQIMGMGALNQGMSGLVLKPWDERKRHAAAIEAELQAEMNQIPGPRIAVFQPAPLPGSGGMPFQMVIKSSAPLKQLYTQSQALLQAIRAQGWMMFIDSDLKMNYQQALLEIDRERLAWMGLSMADVAMALSASGSGHYVNFFDWGGRSYQVIPQMESLAHEDPEQILSYPIHLPNGDTVPFSALASVHYRVDSPSVPHFQQMNAVTLSGVPAIGLSLEEVISKTQHLAESMLPAEYSMDYAGQSRQLIKESGGMGALFCFSLLIIYLSLAALFGSLRDPLIVLSSVPLAIWGAMLMIYLGFGGLSLNIYTEVGLITLIGLITKHGILIVQFANDLRKEGMGKKAAITHAAELRLRPIIMTTAAMVLGVLPLLFAHGAGAVSRFNMGMVIASGLTIGTLFTVIVVPVFYYLFAEEEKELTARTE